VFKGTRDDNNGFKFGWLNLLALRLQSLLITINAIHTYKLYSAIADLHYLLFTVAHGLGFSVSTGRLLGTDLNTETITWNHYELLLPSLTLYSSVLICNQLLFTIH
jgi:hypothetical protein